MSIIDDLVILVEDKKNISLNEVCEKMQSYNKQTISSSLGRLNAKGWIKKKKNGKDYIYNITKDGHQIIDNELYYIKYIKQIEYPNNWLILIFNIPEKLRKFRDELRRQLVYHGFGRLHDSIWFSKQDQKDNMKKIINKMNLKENVIFIYTSELSNQEEINLINRLNWNWKNISNKYKDFINNSKKYLSSKHKESYRAKQLVFQLSKIIKSDPKLPAKFDINIKLKKEAIKLYKKIRPYCY